MMNDLGFTFGQCLRAGIEEEEEETKQSFSMVFKSCY